MTGGARRVTTPDGVELALHLPRGTAGPRRLGPGGRPLAAATMAVSRLLGRSPARYLRFGNEDEAAEIIAEGMEGTVRGRGLGTDVFDSFAGLAALNTPYLGVA